MVKVNQVSSFEQRTRVDKTSNLAPNFQKIRTSLLSKIFTHIKRNITIVHEHMLKYSNYTSGVDMRTPVNEGKP